MITDEDLRIETGSPDIEKHLRGGGTLAEKLDRFQERPQQLEMAGACASAVGEGHHLLVEAGTGTGKSLAYLLPAAWFASEHDVPVVISTNTINLQDQLIENDLPLLQSMLDRPFEYAIAKGRGNYICRKRLNNARKKKNKLFSSGQKHRELNRLAEWVRETDRGSKSDLSWNPDSEVWNRVSARRSSCHCSEPDFQEHCFYEESRERIRSADIIVTNHWFLLEDIALRSEVETGILPDYGALVIDEAHNFEEVARRSFGLETSLLQVRYLISDLYDAEEESGTLVSLNAPVKKAKEAVKKVDERAHAFYGRVREWHKKRSDDHRPVRVKEDHFVRNTLTPALKQLNDTLRHIQIEYEDALDDEEQKEVTNLTDRVEEIGEGIDFFLSQKGDKQVYWVETQEYARNVKLCTSRIHPAEVLKESLFEPAHSVILTSATLATGEDQPFSYIKDRLGIEHAEDLKLGHPFDYREQVTLHIPKDMPHPGYEEEEYIEKATRYTKRYLGDTGGNGFLLFTSYRMMDQLHEELVNWLEEKNIRCFKQGDNLSRKQMLQQFRGEDTAVIFGVASFWEGVDVPGSDLSNVIIYKLPFPNPSDPIVEAIEEYLEEQGENPFSNFFIPEAVLQLRQGFGRLIRTREDSGQVAILDSRILNKSYGQHFLSALPDCRREIDTLPDARDDQHVSYDR